MSNAKRLQDIFRKNVEYWIENIKLDFNNEETNMNITFNQYQMKAAETAIYPRRGSNIIYPALGLVCEAGELSDKIKKLWRNAYHEDIQKPDVDSDKVFKNSMDSFWYSPGECREIIKEMGDVLWYLAALADEIGDTLENVANTNLIKLRSRAERSKIASQGDNR